MRRIIYLAAAALAAIGAAIGVAAPASAVVLVNQPASAVCVGKAFTVGVWYQPSGGPRAYRVAVYNPRGKAVLRKRGRAPSTHWRFWHVRAGRAGNYRTVYRVRHDGKWLAYRALTRARRC